MVDTYNQINPGTGLQTEQRFNIIGKVLLDMHKISQDDLNRILQLQNKEKIKFGDAGKKLGLLKESDIQQALALQFDYPYLPEDQVTFDKALVAAYQPFSPQVEALRALRSQLVLRWFGEERKSLAIIPAASGAGASYLAANLAVLFSQLGQKTLLIDANLRQPMQHQTFKLPIKHGLSDVLVGRAEVQHSLYQIPSLLDLTVLSAGTKPPNPQELLNSSKFTHLIHHLSNVFDVVIVDTAPADHSADAQITALRCGGALLVSKKGETGANDIVNVRDQLNMASVHIVGSVLNEF